MTAADELAAGLGARLAAAFREAEHPRLPPGEHGGQFTRLEGTNYPGETGNPEHITRTEAGQVPIGAVARLAGVEGERPGEHRNRQGPAWEAFKADIAAHGIRTPLFITVDHGQDPKISEGSHRRDAAAELGLTHVPVEVRYFGHAERQGTLTERAARARAAAYRESQHPRGPGGQWVTLDWDATDRLVAEEFHPVQMDANRVAHPRSGYMVETGIQRRVHRPDAGPPHGNESLGIEGPPVFDVSDYGDPTAPGHNSLAYPKHVGTEPIPHVYRAMTAAEWDQAQARGYIQSDQRGTISPLEGTNAAADPRSAVSYLPYEPGRSVVAKIRVDPADKWFTIRADEYLRTRQKIPVSRVEHVVDFERTPRVPGVGESLRARRTTPARAAGQDWAWTEPDTVAWTWTPEAEAG